jgi:hypothetical protein
MSDKSEEHEEHAGESTEEEGEGHTVLGDNAGVHVGSAEGPKHPPIDFGNFVMSLAHSTLVALGEVEHPELGETDVDLPTAEHTIQILEMLKEKTQNNLEPEEEKLLGSLLYELRISFVNVSAKKVDTPSSDS